MSRAAAVSRDDRRRRDTVLLESDGQPVRLPTKPRARGGEATLFNWLDRPDLLAKVYHKPTPEHAAKLSAMLAHPPAASVRSGPHPAVAWPLDRLLSAEDHTIVGYVMPYVAEAHPAVEFFNPRSRLRLCPLFHHGYLLRTARNLAEAVRALHERGYVVGDLNESNVLVTSQAFVTLVDADSMQVPRQPGPGCYRCPVGKPEYTPPELQRLRFRDFDRGPEHDAFALSVLIFQLLMQGVHPFAGRPLEHRDATDLATRIMAGQWPYARSRPVPFRPSPHAPPFESLPPAVQDLMRRCFEDGHARSMRRPSAAEWFTALSEAEQHLAACPVNPQHVFSRHFQDCPWCRLTGRLGRDPFPAPGSTP
jgi:DNA-binding helix-hairpin-helix protein with protein kinase domain